MKPYASGTEVPVERSKAELDSLLGKHGATQRGVMSDEDRGIACAIFTIKARQYRLELPLPKPETFPNTSKLDWEQEITCPQGWNKWTVQQRRAWVEGKIDQATRERWRAVVLLVKAKLEIVSIGLSSVEKEFLADLVLPNGQRMHAAVALRIEEAYLSGAMPRLLLGPGGGE